MGMPVRSGICVGADRSWRDRVGADTARYENSRDLFPPDERSFAFGVGTAIAGLGTIAMPFFIPIIAAIWGWRGALIFGGLGGFVTLALWLWFARGVKFDDKAEDEQRDYSDDGAVDGHPHGGARGIHYQRRSPFCCG